VVLAWAWPALVALLAGAVIAARVGSVYGQHPGEDTALWHEGGLELLDLVVRARGELSSLGTAVAVVIGLGTLLGVWPYALLLQDGLHAARPRARARRPRLTDLARDALPSLPTLLALRLLFLAGAVLLAVAAFFAMHLGQAVGASGGNASDVRIDVTGWTFGLVVLAGFVVLEIALDAMAAAAVNDRRPRLGRALLGGYELLRAAGGRLTLAWTWRTVTGLLLVAVGAWVASHLGGRGGSALVLLALVHQLVALARAALRASWLASLTSATGSQPRENQSREVGEKPSARLQS
jgi:hypothetical protein